MKFKHLLTSVSVLTCALAAQPAFAQDQQPKDTAASDEDKFREIIVTAERRESSVQKTAGSISVRTGNELLAQGRYTLRDILEDIPGMAGGAAESSRSSFGSGTDNPAAGLVIRGIQSNLGAGGSTTSIAASAAIYVDGVYNGIGGSYDIERVEALRGPQGTLYGRSANSGLVSLHTRDPNLSTAELELSAEAGSYDLLHFAGGVSVPIIEDKLAIRFSGNYHQRDGFYADQNGGRRQSTDGRVKLLFQPSENFSAMVGFAFNDTDTIGSGVTIYQNLPNPITGQPGALAPNQFMFVDAPRSPGTNSARQLWGVFDLDLGAVKLTYIPAYRTFEQRAVIETRGLGIGFDQTILTPNNKFHTQELRIASNNDSPLQWVVGGMYYNNTIKGDYNEVINVVPVTYVGLRSSIDKKTTATGIFGQATWSFTPETRLTAGIRYDHTEVDIDQVYSFQSAVFLPPPSLPIVGPLQTTTLGGAAGVRKYNNISFKVRLEQDLSPDNLVYASVSSGFTPGDLTLTTRLALPPEVPAPTQVISLIDLKDETLIAYEIGAKNRFLNGALQVNGAVYHYDYGGFQVANVNTNLNPGPPTFAGISIPLKVWGAELEVQARPWDNGRISVSLDYSDAKLHRFPVGAKQFFAFERMTGVAPFRLNMSYNHIASLSQDTKLLLGAALHYNSSYNVSQMSSNYLAPGGGPVLGIPPSAAMIAAFPNGLGPLQRVGSKVTGDLNATLTFADGKFSLTAYVRNVTDERFKTTSGLVVNPADGSPQSAVTLNDPRTFGMVLTARF